MGVLIGAVLGAVVTSLGWFANYYLGSKKEENTRRNEAALRHLTTQIQEFYGPLWGLIQESQAIRQVAGQRLPCDAAGRIDAMRFQDHDAEIYAYFKEQFFLPINRRISDLMCTRLHLLEHSQLPDSFRAFLEYQAMFETLHGLWKEHRIDSSSTVRGMGWPMQFNADVESALARLRLDYQTRLRLTDRSLKS